MALSQTAASISSEMCLILTATSERFMQPRIVGCRARAIYCLITVTPLDLRGLALCLPRPRCMAAIQHRKPDHVKAEFGQPGVASTGLPSASGWRQLMSQAVLFPFFRSHNSLVSSSNPPAARIILSDACSLAGGDSSLVFGLQAKPYATRLHNRKAH